jgi:hypothetical protein
MALTYWNRVEPRPRAPEIAEPLAARIRDPVGEFRGEDAASPAYVQVVADLASVIGWRPQVGAALADIDAPLEELVATEGFTPDLVTRVEFGQVFQQALVGQGLDETELAGVLEALLAVPAFAIGAAGLSPHDAEAQRVLGVCVARALDGEALARAHAAGTALPAAAAISAHEAAVRAALDELATEIKATFGTLGRTDAAAWRTAQLEYQAEVVAGLPGGNAAVLMKTDPDRDATFDWFAFDIASDVAAPADRAVASRQQSISRLPTHVRFRGQANPRWWDFERGITDFGAVTPDRRDTAKLVMMDFMLIHGTDYFVVPMEQRIGELCRINLLLVHDVFGGITRIDRADAIPSPAGARWTCFSLSRLDRDGAPADVFFLPPSCGTTRIAGAAIEDVRFLRDEQANLAWAIESSAEGGIGRPWLGHERSVAEAAAEPSPAEPSMNAPLRYLLQSFVPRHWFPLLPVALDAASGETAFELGRMVRPDGTTPEPRGRTLTANGPTPYRVREEAVPRAGVRVLREPVRSRWTSGETHLWLARRTLVGGGEGSSGLRYDRAGVKPSGQ